MSNVVFLQNRRKNRLIMAKKLHSWIPPALCENKRRSIASFTASLNFYRLDCFLYQTFPTFFSTKTTFEIVIFGGPPLVSDIWIINFIRYVYFLDLTTSVAWWRGRTPANLFNGYPIFSRSSSSTEPFAILGNERQKPEIHDIVWCGNSRWRFNNRKYL